MKWFSQTYRRAVARGNLVSGSRSRPTRVQPSLLSERIVVTHLHIGGRRRLRPPRPWIEAIPFDLPMDGYST